MRAFDHTRGYPGEGPSPRSDERLRHHAAARQTAAGNRARRVAAVPLNPPPGEDEAGGLLALSVQPQTARQYLREVRQFVDYLFARRVRFTSAGDKDDAVSGYLAHLAFGGAGPCGPQRGTLVVSGLVYLYPELRHRLPRAFRSLIAWQRNHVGGEGQPEVDETIACIASCMEKNGRLEEADALRLAHDCYLREHDLFQLRTGDVVFAQEAGRNQAALRLGVPERKERTKTGSNQGVKVDWAGTLDMLWRRSLVQEAAAPLFATNQAAYAAAWKAAVQEIQGWPGCSAFCCGPPHSVRHAGPSRDSATGYRSLWQVQRRGRWSSEKSCMRYAKTWAWTAALARTPAEVMRRGQIALVGRGRRPPSALE